jgi:hypothetical protein
VTLSTHAAPDSFVCGYWNADIGPACQPFNLIKNKSLIDKKTCRFAFALCNADSKGPLRRATAALPTNPVFLAKVA